jgi:putative ABC transport system permease protein
MPPMEIVGVVGDAVHSSLRAQVPPTWYAPLSQFDLPEFSQLKFQFQLAVRSQTNSPVASNDVAAAIGRVNPTLALTFRPLSDDVETARNQERLVALLAGAFGTLGLLLAGLGLYGITAYAVTVRRSEIGIRMALGAVAGRIVRLVLARVAILVASGAVAGIAVSLWLSRFVASLLYGVQPHDTATLLAAFIVLASVGLVAGAIPASKAARTNPATVLREG